MKKNQIIKLIKEATDRNDIAKLLYAEVTKSRILYHYITNCNSVRTGSIWQESNENYRFIPIEPTLDINIILNGESKRYGKIIYKLPKLDNYYNTIAIISGVVIPLGDDEFELDYTDINFNLLNDL